LATSFVLIVISRAAGLALPGSTKFLIDGVIRTNGGATNDSFLTVLRRLARGLRTAAWGHEEKALPPVLSARFR
jgi:hypothetical protein